MFHIAVRLCHERQWRLHYNTVRPHSALGYRPTAPESFVPMDQKPIMN
ncbi:MAG: transposase [Rhodospirillaceae bacterium]|nr:transposase [Rhodospirillaceae bacterium]